MAAIQIKGTACGLYSVHEFQLPISGS